MSPKSILILLAFFFGWTASFSVHAQRTGLNQAKTLSVQSNDSLINNSISGNQKEFESSKHSSPFDAVKGKKEDQSKRDAFSKHYINEDGSFTALIGAGPIHYEKNGRFYDIDHTIIPSNDANFPYVNATNLFSSYFGATAHTGVKNKTAEGEIQELLNTKMYWEVNGQIVNEVQSSDVPVSIEGDKAYYHHLFGNIAAELIVLTGKRKLNYIIPSAQDLGNVPANAEYLVFTEDVELPNNWTHSITESGVVIKNPLGKEIYLYENPVSIDAVENELEAQGNTVFETSLNGNTLTIKTKVKTDWLLSGERVFPVKVDPTTTLWPTGSGNYNTGSIDENGNKTSSADIYAGMRFAYGQTSGTLRLMRGWVSFNLTSLPTNISITSSTFGFYTGLNNLYAPDGQYISIGHITSGIPNTATGATLYDMCGEFDGNAANSWFTLSAGNPTGNLSIGLVASQNTAIVNSIPSGIISLGFIPKGLFNYSYTEQVGIYGSNRAQSTSNGRPYIILTYVEIITDRTLTVSEAYTGASHANGNHTFTDGNLVTATSGTRPGYTIVGWTGTGSVPATGTGGTASFTITENSSITWIWEQIGTPNNIIFHNYGGADQLAFNNSRINFNLPVFRMSHSAYDATDYEVEINTSPAFGGASWTQTFTGTYPLNTEANFTFNNGFTPTNGTTYYVRARVRGAANVWSSWTTETYSFTYDTNYPIPNWFQTTQAQFQTDELSGVVANGSHDVVLQTGGGTNNPFTNPSFESSGGWTTHATGGSPLQFNLPDNANWSSAGSRSARMYMWSNDWLLSSDYALISQTVDLTGIETIVFDAQSHYGQNMFSSFTKGSKLELIIGGTATNTSGTVLTTTIHCVDGSASCTNQTLNITATIPAHLRTTGQIVKFVWSGFAGGGVGGALVSFAIDNIRAEKPSSSQGTITSTPIHLASVQGASSYTGIIWNQTLGGGNLTLKVQGSTDGTNFTDIAGYTAISQTGDGEKTHDISGISPVPPHIRLVGTLNGANVTLHDWAIIFDDNVLPVELTNFSASCETGETSIHWTTASETNSDYFAVEKSRDGINWVVVGEKAAAGTSTAEVAYRFIDKNSTSGISYYRLRQVDFDGAAEIFGPISSTCVGNESSMTVYPNPNNGTFTVEISSDKTYSDAQLYLTDMTGKSIVTKQLDVSEGTTQFNIDDLNLSNGIYFVKVQGEGMQLEPVKVIVNK